jgi:hypothetical protein
MYSRHKHFDAFSRFRLIISKVGRLKEKTFSPFSNLHGEDFLFYAFSELLNLKFESYRYLVRLLKWEIRQSQGRSYIDDKNTK